MPEVDGYISMGVKMDEQSYSAARARLQTLNKNPEINFKINPLPLGRLTGDVKAFDQSLQAALARTLAFGAATSSFYAVGRAVASIAGSFIATEAKFKSIEVIIGSTTQKFNQFKSAIFDIGKNTGKSFDEVSDAAVELARQGLGAEETLKRLNAAMILSRQSGLTAADAVSDLTAIVNTFAKESLDAVTAVNKLANVDASFAVSSKDLAESIKRAGASASDAGVSFDKLIALTTSLQQTTARGGAVIGNALKSIFTRVERTSTLDALEQFNVSTRDLQGNVLSADRILQNLANTYKTLSSQEKSVITERVAGIQQINQLKAVLGDLSSANSVYNRSLAESQSSTNQAIERNKLLNETLQANFIALKNSATQFSSVVGKLTFEPVIKTGGGALSKIFNIFENTDEKSKSTGQKIGEGILTGIGNALNGPALVLGLSVAVNITKRLGGQLIEIIGSYSTFSSKTKEQHLLQQSINEVLAAGNTTYRQRLLAATSLAEQEKVILAIMAEQNAIATIQSSHLLGATKNIIQSGGKVRGTGEYKIPNAAGGYSPVSQEQNDINSGVGGASRSARPKIIPNFNFGGGKVGPIVANTDEYLVPNYAGSGGSAIFNQNMAARLGLPGNAQRISAAGGFIPNYAPNRDLVRSFTDQFYKAKRSLQPEEKLNSPATLSPDERTFLSLEKAELYGEKLKTYNEVSARLTPARRLELSRIAYGHDQIFGGLRNIKATPTTVSGSINAITSRAPDDVTRRQLLRLSKEFDYAVSSNPTNVAGVNRRDEVAGQIRNLRQIIAGKKEDYDVNGRGFGNFPDLIPRRIQTLKTLRKYGAKLPKQIPSSDFLFRGVGIHEITNLRRLGQVTSLGESNADNKLGTFITSSFGKAAGFGAATLKDSGQGYVLALDKKRILGRPTGESIFGSEEKNTIKAGRITKDDVLGIVDLKTRQIRSLEEFSRRNQDLPKKLSKRKEFEEFLNLDRRYVFLNKARDAAEVTGQNNPKNILKFARLYANNQEIGKAYLEYSNKKAQFEGDFPRLKNLLKNPDRDILNTSTRNYAVGYVPNFLDTRLLKIFRSLKHDPVSFIDKLTTGGKQSNKGPRVGGLAYGDRVEMDLDYLKEGNQQEAARVLKHELVHNFINRGKIGGGMYGYNDDLGSASQSLLTAGYGTDAFYGEGVPQTLTETKERAAKYRKLISSIGNGHHIKHITNNPQLYKDRDFLEETLADYDASKFDSAFVLGRINKRKPNGRGFLDQSDESVPMFPQKTINAIGRLSRRLEKMAFDRLFKGKGEPLARGYVPNFNNPLISAIQREKSAGIPIHQIRVENHPSLISGANPGGLAVTNTRDEPGGINQGISRAISEGKNPKTYGLPNFADTSGRKRDSRGRLLPVIPENIGFSKTYGSSSETEFNPFAGSLDAAIQRLEASQSAIPAPTPAPRGVDITKEYGGNLLAAAGKQNVETAKKFLQTRIEYYANQEKQQKIAAAYEQNGLEILKQRNIVEKEALAKRQKLIVGGIFSESAIASSYKNQQIGTVTKATAEKLAQDKLEFDDFKRQEKEKRQSRRQQIGLGLAFGAPVLGGVIQSAGIGGKQLNSGINAASTGLTIAAVLGLGPVGIAAGLVAGTLLGLKGSAEASRKSLEEYSKELQDTKGRFEQDKTSASNIFQVQEQLKDIIERGGSNQEISIASNKIQEFIGGISDVTFRNKVIGAKTEEEKRGVLTEISAAESKEVARKALGGLFETVIAPNRGPLGDKFGATENILLKKDQISDIASLIQSATPLSSNPKKRAAELAEFQADPTKLLKAANLDPAALKQFEQFAGIIKKDILDQVVQRKLSAEAISKETNNLKAYNSSLLNINRTLERLQSVTGFKFGLQGIKNEGIRGRAISGAQQSLAGVSEFLSPEARNRQENRIALAQIANERITGQEKISTDYVLSLKDLPKNLEEAFKKFESEGGDKTGGLSVKSRELKNQLTELNVRVQSGAENPIDAANETNQRLNIFKSGLNPKTNADLIKAINDFQEKGFVIPVSVLNTADYQKKLTQEQINALNKNTLALQKSSGFFGGGGFKSINSVDTSDIITGLEEESKFSNERTNPFGKRILKSRGNSFDDFFSGKTIDLDAEKEVRAKSLAKVAAGRLQQFQLGLFNDNPNAVAQTRSSVAAANEAALTNQIAKLRKESQNIVKSGGKDSQGNFRSSTGTFDILADITPEKIKSIAKTQALQQVPLQENEKLVGLASAKKIVSKLDNLGVDFSAGVKGNFEKLSEAALEAAKSLLSAGEAASTLARFTSEQSLNKQQGELGDKANKLQKDLQNLLIEKTQAEKNFQTSLDKKFQNDEKFYTRSVPRTLSDKIPSILGLGITDFGQAGAGRLKIGDEAGFAEKLGLPANSKQIREAVDLSRQASLPNAKERLGTVEFEEKLKKTFAPQIQQSPDFFPKVIDALVKSNNSNYQPDSTNVNGGLNLGGRNIRERLLNISSETESFEKNQSTKKYKIEDLKSEIQGLQKQIEQLNTNKTSSSGNVDVNHQIQISISGTIESRNEDVKSIVEKNIADFKNKTEAEIAALRSVNKNAPAIPPKVNTYIG